MARPETQKAIPNSYMARGWQPGTGQWVTKWGSSRDDVRAQVLASPYPLENVKYYGPIAEGVKE